MDRDEKDILEYTAKEDCKVQLTSGSAYYGRDKNLFMGEWQTIRKGEKVVSRSKFSITIKPVS
jgi:hypothetical protein